MLNGNDGGVALSMNWGDTFSEKDQPQSGYNTSQFYGVSKQPGSSVYIGGTQVNGTWVSPEQPDNRVGWSHEIGGDGFETIWHATDPKRVMGTSQLSNVFLSKDGGASFEFSFPPRLHQSQGLFFSPLATSDAAPDEVYTLSLKRFGAQPTLVRTGVDNLCR